MLIVILALAGVLFSGCGSSPHPTPGDDLPPRSRPRDDPPPTRRQDVVDVYHGVKVVDPYRWLEFPSHERDRWFAAQNAHARRILRGIPGRELLRSALHKANRSIERVEVLGVIGPEPQVFALRRGPSDETFKLVVRGGWRGRDRILVDPAARASADSHVTIDDAYPSPDGRYVAYSIARAGSEEGTLEVVDTRSGKVLPDRIDRSPLLVSWRSDGRSFFYWRRAEARPGAAPADKYKNSAAYLHTLGDDPAAAKAVIAPAIPELGLRPEDMPAVSVAPRSRWVVADASPGTGDPAFFVAPVAAVKPGRTRWRRVATRQDKVERMAVHGDRLYALTYLDAPNYRIVSFDARSGRLSNASTFVPVSDLVLADFGAARDAMYVVALDSGVHRLFRFPWRTGTREEVALPFEGFIQRIVADPDRRGLVFGIEARTRRPAWYQFIPGAGVGELPMTEPSTGVGGFVTERETVVSRDGTEVPLSIIRGRDTALDGSAPALLLGYGAYGLIQSPTYNPLVLAWVERGGVHAVCHVRGGGDRGKAWHLAGIKQNKENGVDDFIGCAERLIRRRYTASARLTAFGGSAGGIVIGGAITKRPELFAAAAIRVGQMNPLRKEVTEGGPANRDEYGDVTVEAEFRSLLASDPYHRIRDGVDYPAVLLTTGLHDLRVSPWVPGKFAARLQAARQQGTGRARPTLLRVESDDGHGFSSTQTQLEEEYADIYAFALWNSGIGAPYLSLTTAAPSGSAVAGR